jgi:N-acetylneuraminic acid mutarotase
MCHGGRSHDDYNQPKTGCSKDFREVRMRIAMIKTALMAAMLVAGSVVPAASQSTGGVWAVKAPMPAIRNEVAAAAVNGKLYVFGGSASEKGGRSDLTRNEEYDPANNSWLTRKDMPFGGSHMIATSLNGKIYVVGGFLGSQHRDAFNHAAEYDPATDGWRSLAPLSSPRGSVSLAAAGGKIHAFGGRGTDLKTTTIHQVLDPATGIWTMAAPLTKSRDHTATVEVDGKIHVIAGRFTDPGDTTDMHEIYDPATDKWSSAPPLPRPRSSLAVTVYKGMILVVGGETTDSSLTDNEGFDVKANRWVKLAPLPSPRHGIAGAAIGDHVYFAGGAQGVGARGTSDQLFVFTMP